MLSTIGVGGGGGGGGAGGGGGGDGAMPDTAYYLLIHTCTAYIINSTK